MGNLRGHLGPACGFMFMGLFLYIRALRGHVPFLRRRMNSKFWWTFEGATKLLIASVGFMAEFHDVVVYNSWNRQSHWEHLRLFGIVIMAGILDLVQLYQLIGGPLWGFMSAASFVLVGALFSGHAADNDFETMLHLFTGYMLFFAAISKCAEYGVGMHCNVKHHDKVRQMEKQLRFLPRGSLKDRVSRFFSNSDQSLAGLYSVYTNPVVYQTVLPSITACFIILTGLWWFQISYSLYLWPVSDSMLNGHHAMSLVYKLLVQNLAILLGIVAVISVFFQVIDKCLAYRTLDGKEAEFAVLKNLADHKDIELEALGE